MLTLWITLIVVDIAATLFVIMYPLSNAKMYNAHSSGTWWLWYLSVAFILIQPVLSTVKYMLGEKTWRIKYEETKRQLPDITANTIPAIANAMGRVEYAERVAHGREYASVIQAELKAVTEMVKTLITGKIIEQLPPPQFHELPAPKNYDPPGEENAYDYDLDNFNRQP